MIATMKELIEGMAIEKPDTTESDKVLARVADKLSRARGLTDFYSVDEVETAIYYLRSYFSAMKKSHSSLKDVDTKRVDKSIEVFLDSIGAFKKSIGKAMDDYADEYRKNK